MGAKGANHGHEGCKGNETRVQDMHMGTKV